MNNFATWWACDDVSNYRGLPMPKDIAEAAYNAGYKAGIAAAPNVLLPGGDPRFMTTAPICFKCGHVEHTGECVNVAPTQEPVGWLDGRGRFFYATDPYYKYNHEGMSAVYRVPPDAAAQIAELEKERNGYRFSTENNFKINKEYLALIREQKEQIAALQAAARIALAVLVSLEFEDDDDLEFNEALAALREALGEVK